MSETPTAISLHQVGKMYKIFTSRFDNFLDAMGLHRMFPWRRLRYREFWALREIDLDISRGQRMGVVGCNGAGKTTLLKLITGNLAETEGRLHVRGHVHALMSTGAGFHPDFTGRENIEASLIYQGLSTREIQDAIEEIASFTELESFLDQPFKTYSAGMQARLTFATATTLTPDILIIDEVLGAGDGYFIAKSTERITQLVEKTGATVLLVSHALDQIERFCDETIWLDRGRIVQRGETVEIVKAYRQFLSIRNERRLKAKNRLAGSKAGRAVQHGFYGTSLHFRIVVEGGNGARCDVTEIVLRENGEIYERLAIGDVQDANNTTPASVLLDQGCDWSDPHYDGSRPFRSVSLNGAGGPSAVGTAIFHLWGFHDDAEYTADLTYRACQVAAVTLEIHKDDQCIAVHPLSTEDSGWATRTVTVTASPAMDVQSAGSGEPGRAIRRWPSHSRCAGKLTIAKVSVCGPNEQEQAVFVPGQSMTIRLTVTAGEAGTYRVLPAITIFRLDGVVVSKQPKDEPMTLCLSEGESRTLALELPHLNLGEGQYVFSAAIFGEAITDNDRYDLIDRAYEFEIASAKSWLKGAVFHHPGTWSEERSND